MVGLVAGAAGSELGDVERREERVDVFARLARAEPEECGEVLKTTGRKWRSRSMQPGRCLAFFSAARTVKSVLALAAAVETCDGRRGHETVTSIAVT